MPNLAGLVVEQVRQLRNSRLEVDAWREMLEQTLVLLSERERELKQLRQRYHAVLEDRRREQPRPAA